MVEDEALRTYVAAVYKETTGTEPSEKMLDTLMNISNNFLTNLFTGLKAASELTSPDDIEFEKDKKVFGQLKAQFLKEGKYVDQYIAIVHEKLEGVGDDNAKLVREMYDKFGYIPLYVGKVTEIERFIKL